MASDVPFVSICVPNYNNEAYISDCLNSLVNQTYTNYEIVVVDNNSTDRSWEIIKEFKRKYPHLFRIYRNRRNIGMVGNFNRCISYARLNTRSKYACIFHSDDIYDKDIVFRYVSFSEDNNLDVVLSNQTEYRYGYDKYISKFLPHVYFYTATLFLRLSSFNDPIFDEEYQILFDAKFYISSFVSNKRFGVLLTNLCRRNVHVSQGSSLVYRHKYFIRVSYKKLNIWIRDATLLLKYIRNLSARRQDMVRHIRVYEKIYTYMLLKKYLLISNFRFVFLSLYRLYKLRDYPKLFYIFFATLYLYLLRILHDDEFFVNRYFSIFESA